MTVLLVDSDLRVLQGIADALRIEGYDVMTAGSFEEGKRLWQHYRPEVLIVDVRLGQFNGLQLLMRARADRPDVQAIITCPFADRVLEAEARRFGGTFLVKPIDPSQIVGAVGRLTVKARGQAVATGAHFWMDQNHVGPFSSANFTARWQGAHDGPAAVNDRRRGDRRQVTILDFWPERRLRDRRAAV